MKFPCTVFVDIFHSVTPLAGVWVEIHRFLLPDYSRKVTPLAGVWVEIILGMQRKTAYPVTPLAGVWVEIGEVLRGMTQKARHSPCGSVG